MMNLKSKKSGFTLIEVLFSTAIVGVVLMPIYALQGQVMSRIAKAANSVQRMFVSFDFFLDAQDKANEQEKKIEKRSEDPVMQMSYKADDVTSKSPLAKTFNNLQLAKASFEWQVDGKKQSSELISIQFVPPEPEPEKEEKSEKKEQEKAPQKAGAAQSGATPAQPGALATSAGAKK